MATPKFKTRKGAASGEPSMLWIGKSGRYYRNIVHAKIDNPANAINGNGKSTASVKQAATNNLFFIVIAVLAILILIRLIK